MAIKLTSKNGNLDLTTGAGMVVVEGGYYTPNVDEEGNLSWIPSKPDLPPIEEVNIKGEPGEQGESGVYVGTTEPTDDEMLIWINPEGEAGGELATTEYVDAAIKAALEEVENGTY